MEHEKYDVDPRGGNLVGYTHGMISAIYKAAQRGPWCTPFEIAVGKKTTKLASCFTCSTFMYAAGFPPSNIHLGRGESWSPIHENAHEAPPIAHATMASLNTRWRVECAQHLQLGVEILRQNGMAAVNVTHRERLGRLYEYVAEHANDVWASANLILDAVTVHDQESARIDRTLVAG
jgi:hypothetical protein